jgi:cytochrome c-type biogenesis protein CcmH/NrfG
VSLERYWKLREEEERDRKHRRKLKEMSDEHWERVRAAGGFSPWAILFVALLVVASFIYFAYGMYRAQKTLQPAVKTPAPQGQPPNNARRTRAQEAPARK